MGERNIRLTLGYDGTDFLGWQIQKQGRTVQGEIEKALARMHGHSVRVTAAGRTDTGVHATGQVANFFTDIDSIPSRTYYRALNSYLPRDIRVVTSCEAPDTFSARKSARARIYNYHLCSLDICLPHIARYSLHVRRRLEIGQLNRFASVLVGEHDFSAFAGSRDTNESKVRAVFSSSFFPQGYCIVYRIVADSFLYKMVRSIVGTILYFTENNKRENDLTELLVSCNRNGAGPTAPAKGLFLDKVLYEREEDYFERPL